MRKLIPLVVIGISVTSCSKKAATTGTTPSADEGSDATVQNNTSTATSAETAISFSFMNPALSVAAATCSMLEIVSNGSAGATPLANAHLVNLTSTSSTGMFYSDTGCTVAITSLAVGAGSDVATAYYSDVTVGTPTLTATDTASAPLAAATQAETILATSATGLGSGSTTTDVTTGTGTGTTITTNATGTTPVGPAALLAFTNTMLVQSPTACGTMAVAIQDTYSHNIPATASLPLLLTSTSASGKFYADSKCMIAVNGTTIGANASIVSFFYADPTMGTPTVTATPSAAAKLTAGMQKVTIEGALGVVNAVTQVAAQTCEPISINLPAQAADTAIGLKTSSMTGAYYAESGCSTTPITSYNVGIGDTAFTVYYKETVHNPLLTEALTLTPPATANVAPVVYMIKFY